jgi:glycosyltransferase involved in cell wall biosynthesis
MSEKMNPLVTVGLCVRNCEDYINETIKSLLSQDFPHALIEVVAVDGNSTDKTLSIIKKELGKSNVKTEIFSENEGLGVARQIVVDNARGDYVLWVDGDMIMSEDYLRKLLDFMDQHAEVGIVKGKQALKPGRNLLATLESYSRAAGRMVDYRSEKGRSKALGTAGALCRIEAIKQAGGFDRNLRLYNEDWDMEIRVRAAGWSLCNTDAWYLDYERLGLTWKGLWKRYWLRGYYSHYFLHKKKGMIKHYRMFPPAAFASGILNAFTLFKLTRLRAVFLLPFQSLFKMTAWYAGYVRSHMDSYAPKL